MNSLLTLTTQDIPLPQATERVWFVLKLRGPHLLELTAYDIPALRRRIARRKARDGKAWTGGTEGA
jgi:hypothetical protein